MGIRALRNASALAALVGIAGCGRGGRDREAYLGSVAEAEAPVEASWSEFDRAVARGDDVGARRAAEQTAAAASSARDRIGRLTIPPSLDTARREELVFLSHVALGFPRYAAGGDLSELRSILQRGRIHQNRGREAARQGDGAVAFGEPSDTRPLSRISGPTSGSRP